MIITQEACDTVNKARNQEAICAVGTTTMRAAETFVSTVGDMKYMTDGQTSSSSLPYDFNVANCMTQLHAAE